MNKITHWGEIERENDDIFVPDITADVERSMNKFCLAEYDANQDQHNLNKTEQITLQNMDPLIMYTINLHKHANDMTEMIRVAELAIESNLIPPEDAIPPIPDKPNLILRHSRNSLNYIPKRFTAFSLGKEIDVPEISYAGAKQVLIKCVAVLTAHIGFETTHQSVLDFLTEILEAFLLKLGEDLRVAIDDQKEGRLCGFPNPIERVLTELGLGGTKGLHDYYQNRVIKYIEVMQKRCRELNNYYTQLLIPRTSSPVDKLNRMVKVKVEEEDTSDFDNPEMHFPTLEGEIGLLSLETGFQLLNSLEAETNLQSIPEGEDEIKVNASPSVVVSESDSSNLSPYPKKKRNR
ncbi:STAGA complex 65 subunit gamma [Onthophagus taurus]|uniref:STAGA complex 65 subunit gamma n=1 Tax=Onthophagus taurus TaxID=166361 RepID=UPI000C1FD849|nr:STAGA complex 65 subunit gamma-like [Onthophagus taurus]